MKFIGKPEVVDTDTNTNQLTTFTLAGDSGINQTISHGDTLTVIGGNAIATTGGNTDSIRIDHDDTSSQASVNNSGRTYIQDITLDTYGHVTALTSATETVTNTDTNTNQLTEFSLTADSGSNQIIAHEQTLNIAGGNAISTVVGDTDTVTINHNDTSSQASVNNSGRTYIQDIVLDTYGHVTGLTSATETVTNTDSDSLFSLSSADVDGSSDTKSIVLSSTNNEDVDPTIVNIAVGDGLSIANEGNKITLTNTVSDTNTQLSNAQVRSAVEAATDSNVFTDADHTKLNGIEASADVTDTANVTSAGALMDSELTDLAGVKGMTVANKANVASPTFTGTPAAPTASSSTNTTQIATTAFVKAQYNYQYLTFSFKTTSYISNSWVTPSQNGPEYYLWNNSHGADGLEPASHSPAEMIINESADETEYYIEVDYLDQPSAFVIPKACKLDGFYGNCRTNNTSPSSARPVIGLFRAAEPADSNTNDVIAGCVAIDKYDTSTGNRKNRFLKLENQGLDTNLAQGDLLFPAVGLDTDMDNSSGMIWGSFTIVLKTLIT